MMSKESDSEYFFKYLLMSDNPVESINQNADILFCIIPEISNMVGFLHKHPHHHLDVFHHTLLALSKSKDDFIVRVALLFHDIGKPFCYQEGEVRHFVGHQKTSASMTKDILTRLEFDKEKTDLVCRLIEMHDTIITDKLIEEDKNFCLKLYEVQRCDALAHHPDKLEKRLTYLKTIEEKLTAKKQKIKKQNERGIYEENNCK